MFLSDLGREWDSSNLKSLFKSWSIVAANLKQLHLISANMNTIPHVPFKARKDDFSLVE
jgi:hypothetical protein